jgi:two-component system, sensor histidine kinase SagS
MERSAVTHEGSTGQMGHTRPKLWVVAGPGVPTPELKARLSELFEIVPVPAGRLISSAPKTDVQLIITPPEALPRPERSPGEEAIAGLLDAMGQGACVADADGHIVWSNLRFRTFDEATRAKIAAACREAAQALLGRPNTSERTRRFEIVLPEEQRSLELTVSSVALGSESGSPTTVAAIIRDVTSEKRLRQKFDAVDRAGGQLVSFETEAVRRMNVMERLKLLETKIVEYCRELLRFDHFNVRLIDERSGRLEIVMSSGLPQEANELEILPLPDGHGISGYVACTGRSYICHDTDKDKRFLPGLAGARSSLTVPLKLHDKVIGVFNIESQGVGAFNEDDRQFAEIFARYIAMALHMLNLLVVERTATNQAISGRVEGELNEPLVDILREAEWLKEVAERDPEAARHIERIRSDVDAIRRRVKNVATGPQTLLGVEGALAERKRDPLLEGRNVLVADDEPSIRRIIHDVLHNRGANVTTCANGVEAIQLLEQAAAGQRPSFDAVISDIRMPDRNGYEVYASARRCLPGVPVVLMTGFGYDPHHSIVRASQDGLQSVLFKPFPVERLVDEVRKAIQAQTPVAGQG